MKTVRRTASILVAALAFLFTVGAVAVASTLIGTSDADQLAGTEGPDQIYGEGGNDTLSGAESGDYLEAGSVDDTIDGDSGLVLLPLPAAVVRVEVSGCRSDRGGVGRIAAAFLNGCIGAAVMTLPRKMP